MVTSLLSHVLEEACFVRFVGIGCHVCKVWGQMTVGAAQLATISECTTGCNGSDNTLASDNAVCGRLRTTAFSRGFAKVEESKQ